MKQLYDWTPFNFLIYTTGFCLFLFSIRMAREYMEPIDYALLLLAMIAIPIFVISLRWSINYQFQQPQVEPEKREKEKEVKRQVPQIEEKKSKTISLLKNRIASEIEKKMQEKHYDYVTLDDCGLLAQWLSISKVVIVDTLEKYSHKFLVDGEGTKRIIAYTFNEELANESNLSPINHKASQGGMEGLTDGGRVGWI